MKKRGVYSVNYNIHSNYVIPNISDTAICALHLKMIQQRLSGFHFPVFGKCV